MRKFILFLSLLFLTGCSMGRDIDTSVDYSSDFVDGTYSISSRYYNSRGYKENLTLLVSQGIISSVEFTETDKAGQNRIDDVKSLKWENCELDYNQILAQLYEDTILSQGSSVDVVSGATITSDNYNSLLEEALISAQEGNENNRVIDTLSDTYTVINEIDPLNGSQEVLTVTYKDGKVTDITINEVTNNAAFYSIDRSYKSLASISKENLNIDNIISGTITVDTNILNRYNSLLEQVRNIRS